MPPVPQFIAWSSLAVTPHPGIISSMQSCHKGAYMTNTATTASYYYCQSFVSGLLLLEQKEAQGAHQNHAVHDTKLFRRNRHANPPCTSGTATSTFNILITRVCTHLCQQWKQPLPSSAACLLVVCFSSLLRCYL